MSHLCQYCVKVKMSIPCKGACTITKVNVK